MADRRPEPAPRATRAGYPRARPRPVARHVQPRAAPAAHVVPRSAAIREVDAPADLLAILASILDRAAVDRQQIAVTVAHEAFGKGCFDLRDARWEGRDLVARPGARVVGDDVQVDLGQRLQRGADLHHMAIVGDQIGITARDAGYVGIGAQRKIIDLDAGRDDPRISSC